MYILHVLAIKNSGWWPLPCREKTPAPAATRLVDAPLPSLSVNYFFKAI